METHIISCSPLFLAILLFFFSPMVSCRNPAAMIGNGDKASDVKLKTYIVHVLPQEDMALASFDERVAWYHSFLLDAVSSIGGESRMVFTYTEVFSGFAARLTEQELNEMETKPGFVRAYPDRIIPLLTTHSPKFLGLRLGSGLWKSSNLGKNVIIGVLDTGVVPTHPSFHDKGMLPPPSKWKGRCGFKGGCNNKVIGAVSFVSSRKKPAGPHDESGHGTHTTATAAGNFVEGASFDGMASGTSSGIAPGAHLAIYKVCGAGGCPDSAIVAGMDAAVKDGVDILSVSLGLGDLSFDADPIAIAAFSAVEKGVFVSMAAGNDGPSAKSVTNNAPWMLTVAASTLDRSIRARVRLGNGKVFDGQTLYQPHNFTSKPLPLISPGGYSGCMLLGDKNVQGKVVLCAGDEYSSVKAIKMGSFVKKAGGAAMILTNTRIQGYTTLANNHVLPASEVTHDAATSILSYLSSAKNPTASLIFDGTVIDINPAPIIAYFSSRGPNPISPNILKPDIAGPGLNVLAAWPREINSGNGFNHTFNVISGTSMATPHLSGIAALVKYAHPDWSPAAIKSAIMTTSNIKDSQGMPIKDEQYNAASVYAMGAGHVDAAKVSDPGLVYDVGTGDYLSYLCGLYPQSSVSTITRRAVNCSKVGKIPEWQLNYPSIAVQLTKASPITVRRTVTNVGEANAIYKAEVDPPKGVVVIVKPATLRFSKVGEKKSFTLTLSSKNGIKDPVSGNLRWVCSKHVVRSPIACNSPKP